MPFRNLLKTAPPEAVRSLDELFAIAQAMEREAGERYGQLAVRMKAEGHADLAGLFERLASDEQGHESSVLNWSQQRIKKAPDPAAIRWELPETLDEETAAELASSRLINAYRVLSMAVRNEERAFILWSYIAAQAETPEIQEAAEKMAREELGHATLLRRARRNAYHSERDAGSRDRAKTVSALLAEAACLEKRLEQQLTALADELPSDKSDRMRELAAQTREMAGTLAALPQAEDGGDLEQLDAEATAERLVEIYLDTADRSRDEAVLERAQALAREAIGRLSWLRFHTEG